MPIYYTYPADHQPIRTTLLDEPRYLRLGVESLKLRTADARGVVLDADVARSMRRGMASEEQMLELRADGSNTDHATVRIDAVAPGVFRVRFAMGRDVPDIVTPMTLPEFEKPVRCSVDEDGLTLAVRTADHALHVDLTRWAFTIVDAADGRQRFSAGGPERSYFNRWDSHSLGLCRDVDETFSIAVENFHLTRDEGVYGFGETFIGLNKFGQRIDLTNEDACGAMTRRIYKSVPFYISTRGYGVYVNQPARMTFDVGSRIASDVQLSVDDDYLDYFVIVGDSMKHVLDRYTDITGKVPVPPKWSFGLWMSKITYESEDEVMRVARNLREKKLPADVIHLDTGWFETDWVCDLKFSKERFPDPRRMFDNLRDMGFRVSLWQQPYVRRESSMFQEGIDGGYFVKNAAGDLTPSPLRGVIDYTNPKAVKWHMDKFRALFDLGAAAIKTDFGERIPDDGIYHDGTPGHRMHNLYSILYNRAIFETTQHCTGDAIVWARSGTAGSQRYPLHWGGDNSPNFDNIEPSICGGLNLGLCGFSFWSQDIGGFLGQTTPELFTRWMQVGLLGSHARIHGRHDREPYRFGEETESISRRFLDLRARLMPYIWSVAHHSAAAGLPVMRPLVLEFERDRNVRDISNQFMLGPSLMVAPILEGSAVQRDVYFPGGCDWYDWWSRRRIAGGQWVAVDIPRDRTGLFVRENSIIPLGPANQYVDEHPLDRVDAQVFGGAVDTSFELMDDTMVTLMYDAASRTVTAPAARFDVNTTIHD